MPRPSAAGWSAAGSDSGGGNKGWRACPCALSASHRGDTRQICALKQGGGACAGLVESGFFTGRSKGAAARLVQSVEMFQQPGRCAKQGDAATGADDPPACRLAALRAAVHLNCTPALAELS